MDAATFRRHGHALVDWIAEYLDAPDRYPVLSRVTPGDIAAKLPDRAPEEPEPFEAIMADFERVLVPGLTHWNHPGFLAYFAITASAPGVLADFLSAAINQQAMLWRTSPASTELETVSLGWLRRLIGLPDRFEGVIYDTASISTLHALIGAREVAVPGVREKGLAARRDVPPLRVYCSDQAHSSVDKAVMAMGLGRDALQRVPVDDEFRLMPDVLAERIRSDRSTGSLPVAVVATVGTTSTTSVDPVADIADICARERVWLHVDAAYAGVAAMLPSHAHLFTGLDRADSLVVNPHKWLFVPFDLSAFYCQRMETVRSAVALTPDYLQATEGPATRNLMDTGLPLGRRFRSLKLWMVMRTFGARTIRDLLAEHIRIARLFASWVDDEPDFERLAPVVFSVVCFRWRPANRSLSDAQLDAANAQLLDRVNRTGEVFLSHTRLNGRLTLRLAVGHLKTTELHVRRAWDLLIEHAGKA
jgi:aromatic-L-amino-acid decarboxylase